MPELPEVETIRRIIGPQISGRSITSLEIHNPQIIAFPDADTFSSSLVGCSFTEMSRRGKFLIFHLDTQIASLQEQICELSPTEKVTETSDVPDYNERITLLRYALERYTNFDSDEDIPEAVIEAFVEKIVVNENSFDWYLHFSGDDQTPKTCNVEGDKKPIKSSFSGHLMRLRWWRAAQAAIADKR